MLPFLVCGLAGALFGTPVGVERGAAPAAQRLAPSPAGPVERISTPHFLLTYRPSLLDSAQARKAATEAEAGWQRCARLFGSEPAVRLPVDLTPSFVGATGFASPGEPGSRDPQRQPRVGVRYADLEYLGLNGDYVLTHEIAHIFSGTLAGSSLGEGIADWAAGSFAGLPLRPGWGTALREAGLWIEPEALFVTGAFEARPEVDEVIRTAQYLESALLVQFLVQRFGWEKFRGFAELYGKERGRLVSSGERRPRPPPRRGRDAGGGEGPLNPSAVRAVFEQALGESWDRLRSDWEASMSKDRLPPPEAERLVLAQRLYGAVRQYEMWSLAQQGLDLESRASVREAFTATSRALLRGELELAARELRRARALVDSLRRPRTVALAPWGTIIVTGRAARASN